MVHLPAVFGEWVIREGVWHFEIDKSKGGRMFFLKDGCTYHELVGMAQEDYNLDTKHELVEISYPLPDVMLKQMPPNTPPNVVSNDRQVFSVIELCREYMVHLCVSTKVDRSTSKSSSYGDEHYVDEDGDEGGDEGGDEASEEDGSEEDGEVNGSEEDGSEEDGSEEDGEEDVRVDAADEVKVEDQADVNDSDVDYSVYGKLKTEDEDNVYDSRFDLTSTVDGGRGIGGMCGNWCDKIHVGKSFRSKAELVSELRTTAMMEKFAFKVSKSEPELFLAKCRVPGCLWKLRASVKHAANMFWVTKYAKVHTCSLADRTSHRKNCGPKYIGKIFIDQFGIIDGLVPKHIQVSMGTMFGLKMDYTCAYRSLICAQEEVRGTAEEGYDKLHSYLQLIERTNPGSVTDLVCEEGN